LGVKGRKYLLIQKLKGHTKKHVTMMYLKIEEA
jgi:hypothetical protein